VSLNHFARGLKLGAVNTLEATAYKLGGKGVQARLQQLGNEGWQTIATDALNAAGVAKFSWLGAGPSPAVQLRVAIQDSSGDIVLSEPGTALLGGVLASSDSEALSAPFSCALNGDGQISCSGNNRFGQLGNGTRLSSVSPTLVSGINDATALASGAGHSCALRASGEVWYWGGGQAVDSGDGVSESNKIRASAFPIGLEAIVPVRDGSFHGVAAW
jgi:hypothetical protein